MAFSCFAERIVSPVAGVFSNKQFLVINLNEGEEAFYSSSSSNPLESGFAYDGPVLINQADDIVLKVTVLSHREDSSPLQEEYEIKYTVEENKSSFEEGSAEALFIKKITRNGFITVSEGSSLSSIVIPESLKYAFGDEKEKNFLSGTALSLSSKNCLSRIVSCTVKDEKAQWRFLINVKGRTSEKLVQNEDFPFRITDWKTIEFTGKNLIWKIDDGNWSASSKPVVVNRRKAHVLSWQSVAYDEKNPVETYVLPAKPELEKVYDNRAAIFSLKGDESYKLQLVSAGNGEDVKNPFLYTQVCLDSFEGEELSGLAQFAVYSNGIFQGTFADVYEVDKEPPPSPVFLASKEGFYSRSDVELKIAGEYGSTVYVAFTGPHSLSEGTYSENSPLLDQYKCLSEDFKPYDYKTFRLRGGKKAAAFFKFASYAVDSAGNKSPVSEYKLIIDKFNYFIDFSSAAENADGSGARPFNNLNQVLKVINDSEYSHFFVTGNFNFTGGETVISSNCSFTGTGEAASKITFDKDSFLTVKNSAVSFVNCLMEKNVEPSGLNNDKADSRMISLVNSAFELDSCQIYAALPESGLIISSEKSTVSLHSVQVSAQAPSYACLISSADSEIKAADCEFYSAASSSSLFSILNSSLELTETKCSIYAHMGRIIEAVSSNLRLNKNTFSSSFDSVRQNSNLIYKDSKTLVLEDIENKFEVF